MEFLYTEKPEGKLLSDLIFVWTQSFGDGEDYILSFISSSFYRGCFYALEGDKAVSFVHLTQPTSDSRFLYGYAVATLPEYRGRGLCRELHRCIFAMCDKKYSVYGVHPAELSLAAFYRRLGMKECTYRYFSEIEGDGGRLYDISHREYSFMRSMYSEDINTDWLLAGDYRVVGFELEGMECAACLSGDVIVELLAPPHLEGKAARRCASVMGRAKLSALCQSPMGAECALMTYNGDKTDFSMFIE